jgi:hypothetical protein
LHVLYYQKKKMALSLTDALQTYGLLDSEGYLVHPNNPNVKALTKSMFPLLEMQQTGLKLTPQDKMRLMGMQMAFDYYNEELQALDSSQEVEEDEDEDETEEDDSSDVENDSSD